MKRKLLILSLLLVSFYSFGDMILINLEEIYTSGGPEAERQIPIELESFLMDGLFESGHIVFNMGSYIKKDSDEDVEPQVPAREVARSNGASHLLNIQIEYKYSKEEDINVPVGLAYSLISVVQTEVVEEGYLSFDVEGDTIKEKSLVLTGKVLSQIKNIL